MKNGIIDEKYLVELGNIIVKKSLQRSTDTEITATDLTGVAVQDIQIAKAVYESLIS